MRPRPWCNGEKELPMTLFEAYLHMENENIVKVYEDVTSRLGNIEGTDLAALLALAED